MEPGGFLPHLQETASCSCLQRDEFMPYLLDIFFTIHFNIEISAKETDNRALLHGTRCRTTLPVLYQWTLQNYSIRCTPVVIAELHYPLQVSRYCRTTLSTVGQQILQNYTIRCTPVVIAELHYPLYTSSYCRTTLSTVRQQILQSCIILHINNLPRSRHSGSIIKSHKLFMHGKIIAIFLRTLQNSETLCVFGIQPQNFLNLVPQAHITLRHQSPKGKTSFYIKPLKDAR